MDEEIKRPDKVLELVRDFIDSKGMRDEETIAEIVQFHTDDIWDFFLQLVEFAGAAVIQDVEEDEDYDDEIE